MTLMTHVNSVTPTAYTDDIKPPNASELWQSVHLLHLLSFFLTVPSLFTVMDGCSAQQSQDCISE